jgi:hypothetical protein
LSSAPSAFQKRRTCFTEAFVLLLFILLLFVSLLFFCCFASASSSAYHPLSALSSSSFLSQFVSSYDEAEALRDAVDRVEEEEEVIEEGL